MDGKAYGTVLWAIDVLAHSFYGCVINFLLLDCSSSAALFWQGLCHMVYVLQLYPRAPVYEQLPLSYLSVIPARFRATMPTRLETKARHLQARMPLSIR